MFVLILANQDSLGQNDKIAEYHMYIYSVHEPFIEFAV